jgi:hypothetical protein
MISEDNVQIDVFKTKIHEEYENNSLLVKEEDTYNLKMVLKKLFENYPML